MLILRKNCSINNRNIYIYITYVGTLIILEMTKFQKRVSNNWNSYLFHWALQRILYLSLFLTFWCPKVYRSPINSVCRNSYIRWWALHMIHILQQYLNELASAQFHPAFLARRKISLTVFIRCIWSSTVGQITCTDPVRFFSRLWHTSVYQLA